MSLTHIETIELGSSQASITFSSIPQDYTDLKVVLSVRSTKTANDIDNIYFRFNNDSGSNYDNLTLYGTGSSVSTLNQTSTEFARAFYAVTSLATANTFGSYEVYIPNYISSLNKSVSMDGVQENNGTSAWQTISAGLWNNTAAITSIYFFLDAGDYVTGSTFSLYGITAGSDGTTTIS